MSVTIKNINRVKTSIGNMRPGSYGIDDLGNIFYREFGMAVCLSNADLSYPGGADNTLLTVSILPPGTVIEIVVE